MHILLLKKDLRISLDGLNDDKNGIASSGGLGGGTGLTGVLFLLYAGCSWRGHEAHLVAKGFTQTYGVDYEETFSLVKDIKAIRILIAIAAYYDYEIWKMDVKTAFLNGRLNGDIYMVEPEGFMNPKHPRRVCKLQRSIYGLNGSIIVFLILYVDDILLMGNNIPMLEKTPYKLLRGRKPTLDYFRVFGSKCFILNTKDYLTKFDPKSYEGVFLGYSQNSKAYIILNKHTRKVEESLNVTFDETPPPSKTSPLVDDDLDEEEAIKVTEKKNLENDIVDETLEVDEIINIKESRNH
ncbi:retrovirus-related pol polyprotein from transposon TNT 1-94 [Tanacetum coccineum]